MVFFCFFFNLSPRAVKAAGAKIHRSQGAGRTQWGRGHGASAFSMGFWDICFFLFGAESPHSQWGDTSHINPSLSADLQAPQLLLSFRLEIRARYHGFTRHLLPISVPSGVLGFTEELQPRPARGSRHIKVPSARNRLAAALQGRRVFLYSAHPCPPPTRVLLTLFPPPGFPFQPICLCISAYLLSPSPRLAVPRTL